MTVGIPGTGLGGLFYFVLVALMPFHELVLVLQGRSSLARWRRVGFHVSTVFVMFLVLWGESWLLGGLLRAAGASGDPGGPASGMYLKTGQVAAITSVVVLTALLAGAAALRRTPLAAPPQAS